MSAIDWAQTNFERIEQGLNGARGSALHEDRKAALSRFLERGIPTPADEEWRYSDFREVASKHYTIPNEKSALVDSDLKPYQITGKTSLVFINGYYNSTLSRIELPSSAVTIKPLSDLLHNREDLAAIKDSYAQVLSLHSRSLVSLNDALVSDGAAVIIGRSERCLDIEIVHLSVGNNEPILQTPRLLLVLEENAETQIVERFISVGNQQQFTCAVSEISLGKNARCDYYAYSEAGSETIHYHSINTRVDRDAQFKGHLFPFGGKLVRNEVNIDMIGENSHATINGLSVLSQTQHVDNSTVIRHAVPHAESSELFKGIYQDKSRGVFQGTIIVEKDAQKTNAFQSNKALLLSRDASIDSKPQLKIWADDVKCTHGATVGELDKDALFYIKSRGISHELATALLTEAFAAEVISTVQVPALKSRLTEQLYAKLGVECLA